MTLLWVGFVVFIVIMLAIDLGVLHRHASIISAKQALLWTCFCAALALAFCGFTYFLYENNWFDIAHRGTVITSGKQAALDFLTGWVIEQSLSLDNILVIAIIFSYFRVPQEYQHRVLFWGILGALLMRGVMIAAGSALIERFHWIVYVFGVILILTAVKLLLSGDEKLDPDRNPLVRLARKFFPVTADFHGEKFSVVIDGRRVITPLFLVLLVVESTDVLFAVDSIPAIFAITRDPFLVFTSNVFAILALRSLYFALAGVMTSFRYLKQSLVFVLIFVGAKMLLSKKVHIPTSWSLGFIGICLGVGVMASVIASRRDLRRMELSDA